MPVETGHQLLHCSINFRILQSALSILHNYTERLFCFQEPLFRREYRTKLDVRRMIARNTAFQAIEKGLSKQQFLIDHDRQIAESQPAEILKLRQ